MKKSEIEEIEEIKKITKLSSEARNNIRKIFFDNILIATDILLFFVSLMILPHLIPNSISVLMYKTADMLLLIFSIFLFEKAYKEDNDMLALNGIEMLVMSIFTLFTPYGFIRWNSIFLKLAGVYFVIYYIGKSVFLSLQEKKKFMRKLSDINEIVKKESKDSLKKQKLEEEKAREEEEEKKKAKREAKKAAKEKENKSKKVKETKEAKEAKEKKTSKNPIEEEKKKKETKKEKKETTTKKKATSNKKATKKKTEEPKTKKKTDTEKKNKVKKTVKDKEEKPQEQPKRGRGRPRKEKAAE